MSRKNVCISWGLLNSDLDAKILEELCQRCMSNKQIYEGFIEGICGSNASNDAHLLHIKCKNCNLSRYNSDEAFNFGQKFHFSLRLEYLFHNGKILLKN